MDFQGPAHIYWVAPPTNGNISTAKLKELRDYLLLAPGADKEVLGKQIDEAEAAQVQIGLTCATVPDLDAEQLANAVLVATEPQSKWQELSKKRTYDLIKSKFHGIKNLTIAGKPVKDFDDFYQNGPPEMVAWVCKAVMSSEMLSAAERKN